MMADDLNSAPNRERYECSLFVLDKDKKPVGRLIVNKKQEAVNVYPDYYLNPMIEIDTLKNNPDTEYLPFKYGVIRYMSSDNTMNKDFETVGIQIQGNFK